MNDFVNSFKNLVKGKSVNIDNNVFKLHYRFSVMLLIIFSVLLSSKQYFGNPIDCDGSVDRELLNVYCWVTGTFILKKNIDGAITYENLEGLGNENSLTKSDTFTLRYYQWIWIFFCFQALLFYMPRYIWKTWEANRISLLIKDLCNPLVDDKWTPAYKHKITKYIIAVGTHDELSYKFAFCEFLNLCNLVCQLQLMDWYLNGHFTGYVINVLTKPWPRSMNLVFPKRTKCLYTRYGPGGSPETRDALCLLALNILNEKFFFILWFWIMFLFIATIIALIFRCIFILSQKLRIYILRAQVRTLHEKKASIIGQFLSHGQFFLLYTMGPELNPIVYKDLLLSIYDQIGNSYQVDNTYNL